MMMMKGVVVMKTGCLFAEISFTYVVKNYFDNGHISRDCLRTQQLQGGWDTQRKRLSGCFFRFSSIVGGLSYLLILFLGMFRWFHAGH